MVERAAARAADMTLPDGEEKSVDAVGLKRRSVMFFCFFC